MLRWIGLPVAGFLYLLVLVALVNLAGDFVSGAP